MTNKLNPSALAAAIIAAAENNGDATVLDLTHALEVVADLQPSSVETSLSDFAAELGDAAPDTYISDAISQFADNAVDIYNYNLTTWLYKSNSAPGWMERVVNEGLYPVDAYSFYDHIRAAQYCQCDTEIRDNRPAALFHYALLRLAPLYKGLTRETIEALGDIDYDSFETIEELNRAIDSVIDPYWLELALIKCVCFCQCWTYSEIAALLRSYGLPGRNVLDQLPPWEGSRASSTVLAEIMNITAAARNTEKKEE